MGRITRHNGISWNVPGHDAAGPDNAAPAEGYALKDHGICPYPDIVFNPDHAILAQNLGIIFIDEYAYLVISMIAAMNMDPGAKQNMIANPDLAMCGLENTEITDMHMVAKRYCAKGEDTMIPDMHGLADLLEQSPLVVLDQSIVARL